MKTVISFRLRKELDADLIALGIDEESLPDLCRNGLRLMLGIQTAKQVELKDRPIVAPKPVAMTMTASNKTLPGKPAVFKPNNFGGKSK